MSKSNLPKVSPLTQDLVSDLACLESQLRALVETLATDSEPMPVSTSLKQTGQKRKREDAPNSQSKFPRTDFDSDSDSNASLLSAVKELEIAYPGLFDWTKLTEDNTVTETPVPSPELLAAAAEVNAIFPDLNNWIPPSCDTAQTHITCFPPYNPLMINQVSPHPYPDTDTETVTDIARTALSHLPLVNNLLKQRTDTREQKIVNCNKAIKIIMDEALPYDDPFQAAMGLVFLKEIGLWQHETCA